MDRDLERIISFMKEKGAIPPLFELRDGKKKDVDHSTSFFFLMA